MLLLCLTSIFSAEARPIFDPFFRGVPEAQFAPHNVSGMGVSVAGGRTGSICHFAISLVLQCLEVPRYPDAGKNSMKSVIFSHPFSCAPNANKN